jgi:hypothetical protein
MLALTVSLSRAISFLKWFDLVGCELLDEKLVWFRYLRERNKYMRKWRHGKHDKNHYPGMTAAECQRSHCLKYFTEVVGSDQRSIFKDMPVHELNIFPGGSNTHPVSAADRTASSNWLDTFITFTGNLVYSVSMSNKDQRNHTEGTRLYHFNKDLQMEFQVDPCLPHHTIKMVDVDYYVDMNEYLRFGQPIALYTFCPDAPAGTSKEYSWSTTEDVVTMRVCGGSHYSHRLWDYNVDHVLIHGEHWSYLYLVESRSTGSPNRRLVYFNPLKRIHRLARHGLQEDVLKRRSFSLKDYNVSYSSKEGQTLCHISQSGSEVVASFPAKAAFTACSRIAAAVKGYSISEVQKVLEVYQSKEEKEDEFARADSALGAALFIGCMNANPDWDLGKTDALMALPVADTISYTMMGQDFLTPAKPSGRVVGPRFGNAFVPTKHPNNDAAMITGRINAPGDRGTRVPVFYAQTCLLEFLKFLIPDPHTLHPISLEEAEEHMTRPSQKAQADRTRPWLGLTRFKIESMQKPEAYATPNYPRSISNCSTDHKLDLSCFSYPFTDAVMKPQHWYSFGKDPQQLTDFVIDKVADLQHIDLTDISKFDGSVNSFLDFMFKCIMMRSFRREYHVQLMKLLADENNCKVYTHFSKMYNSRYTTVSGSSITTGRNTSITAFVYYCSLRKCGYEAPVAWKMLGGFGGDDGMQGHLTPGVAEKVFSCFNLKLKIQRVLRGDPITFLGRVYLNPWNGSRACIADVPRQLRKLHISCAGADVPKEVCLVRKAESMLVNDRYTPILSVWASKTLQCFPCVTTEKHLAALRNDDSWWASFETVFTGPETPAEVDDLYGYVSTLVGRSVSEIKLLEQRIRDSSISEFLSIDEDWFDEKVVAPLPYELGGIIHPATEPVLSILPLPPADYVSLDNNLKLYSSVSDAIDHPGVMQNLRPDSRTTEPPKPQSASSRPPRYPGIANLGRSPGKTAGFHSRGAGALSGDVRDVDPFGKGKRSQARAASYRQVTKIDEPSRKRTEGLGFSSQRPNSATQRSQSERPVQRTNTVTTTTSARNTARVLPDSNRGKGVPLSDLEVIPRSPPPDAAPRGENPNLLSKRPPGPNFEIGPEK